MLNNQNLSFKLPLLRILENEHQYLQYLMNQWHPIVLSFEEGQYTTETGHEALKNLRQMMMEFLDPFKNHTDKEEKFLFPSLAKYIGDEQGPILSLEEEHEEIDAYL